MPFIHGALAGYGIAIPVGAIAILIVSVGLQQGFRPGFMAGAGAATADVLFAALAALAGQILSSLLVSIALPLQVMGGLVLVGLGGYGLWQFRRTGARAGTGAQPALTEAHGGRLYRRFLGLTLLNPMTVIYFGSIILGGGGAPLSTALDRVLFVLGAGAASLSWQTLLAGFGALARRRLSPRLQAATTVLGNLIVLGLGANILIRLAAA